MSVTVPNQTVAITRDNLPTPDFRRWQLAITDAVNTPAEAAPVEPVTGDYLPLSTYVRGVGGIAWEGTLEMGGVLLSLESVADSGAGALLGITVDAYGRVSGTTDATITGTAGQITVANGDAVAGPPTLSLADVADAGGGALLKTAFDAKGRMTGSSAATAADLPIADAGGYFTGADVEAALQELGAGGGGGASAFTDLSDAPAAYTGAGGYGVAVKATEDGLEFVPLTGSGTVTSVGVTNTGGGLTITGSPVTGAGNINADLSAATVASLALADTAMQPGDNAANLSITDAGGYFTGTDVEAALQELGAGAGGSAEGFDPSLVTFVHNDLETLTAWSISGGGGAFLVAAAAGRTGVMQITNGTAAGAFEFLYDPVGQVIVPGGSTQIELHYGFKTDANLSDGTNTYGFLMGLNSSVTGAATNRLTLRYSSDDNSGNWTVRSIVGGSASQVNGTFGPSASTWYRARIVINAAGTSADVYVRPQGGSEQLVGTTSAIPSAAMFNVFSIARSAGSTSRSLYCDFATRWHRYSTPR